MISVHFQSKPFNITVIQVYTPTIDDEEVEVNQLNEDLQDLLGLITKKDGKLLEMRMSDHLTSLLRNLHVAQETTFRTEHGTTDWFKIGKGAQQGCTLSPCLFNLYAEYIM